MKKACKYCGKIHDRDYVCDSKPTYRRIRDSDIDRFRGSQQWIKKRADIKDRDKHLCQACLNNLHGTTKRITTDDLSIHHIIPLKKAWDMRLDDNNLITLCRYHHEMAEKHVISARQLREIVPPRV